MTTIKKINPANYDIPMKGNSMLHKNLEWYATDDDRLLGVVLLDLIDKDYSWVVLGDDGDQPGYVCLHMDASLTSIEKATEVLHKEMLDFHKSMGPK